MNADNLKREFVDKYLSSGEDKFYRFLLTYAVNKLVAIQQDTYKGTPPHIEFLGYHDKFIILYRQDGEDVHLKMAKLFRKAAHKVYRLMLKKEMTLLDIRFLNVI